MPTGRLSLGTSTPAPGRRAELDDERPDPYRAVWLDDDQPDPFQAIALTLPASHPHAYHADTKSPPGIGRSLMPLPGRLSLINGQDTSVSFE